MVSSDIYFDKRDEYRTKRDLLEGDWIEIEALFEEKEIWEMRANWLEQHQPTFASTQQIDEAIYQKVLAPDVTGIETTKKTLLPTEYTDFYTQAGVAVTAKGDLPSIFRWIYDLTPADSFRVVRNLKITPDKEAEENVIAQFELLRWYAPQDSAGTGPVVPAPAPTTVPETSAPETPAPSGPAPPEPAGTGSPEASADTPPLPRPEEPPTESPGETPPES